MGLRADLRTQLQAIQASISGIEKAELNVPNAISTSHCPVFVNLFRNTTYASYSGDFADGYGDLNITMKLYMGAFNTVTAMENKADSLIEAVESAFLGNTTLSLNNVPLAKIDSFRLVTNSGITSQPYIVGNSSDTHYAVVDFPAIVRLRISTENC